MKQFSAAKKWLGDLDCDTAASLLTAASDVTLIVSDGDGAGAERGVIRDVAFGSDDFAREIDEVQWVGQQWSDTVTSESRPKVEALLRDAAVRAPPRWRQVNHRIGARDTLPVLYTAIRAGAKASVIVVGRSMQPVATLQQRLLDAQQAMEREYSRLRQAETRYRLLFQVASEAVVIVDAATRSIVDANPAAVELLEQKGRRPVGRTFPEGLDVDGTAAVEQLLATVRATGRTDSVTARSLDGKREFSVSVSLFREQIASFFLVRVSLARDADPANGRRPSRVLDIVESVSDGFLVTDLAGAIRYANRAFLDMVQLATPEQARGESLDRWLGRPGVDFNLLTAHLREHRSIRLFATTLRGEYGSTTDVEICAVAVPDGEEPCLGFTLRDVGQRLAVETRVTRDKPRSVEQLTELVGRVPLKDLVRESSDVIERLCIEAALELTNDNRASAAEILGLSRQSLYAKLRRHGLGDLESPDDDSAGEVGRGG